MILQLKDVVSVYPQNTDIVEDLEIVEDVEVGVNDDGIVDFVEINLVDGHEDTIVDIDIEDDNILLRTMMMPMLRKMLYYIALKTLISQSKIQKAI